MVQQQIMKPWRIIPAVILACAAQLAMADAITILNPGFEDDYQNCAPGPYCANLNAISHWTGYTPAPFYYTAPQFGAFRPGAGQYPAGIPEGINVAYLATDLYEISIYQVLTATLAANTTYTLAFDVGVRADVDVVSPGFVCAGYVVSLSAGSTVLASLDGVNAPCPAQGTFQPGTLTYTSGANPADLGQPLKITLKANASGSLDIPSQVNFDKLSLSSIATAFADADGDGVPDIIDNCINVANPDQLDTDGDGYGNKCDADLNNDGRVNFTDLSLFKAAFGTTNANADLTGDGRVNFADLAIFKGLFGKAPGPSGLRAIAADSSVGFTVVGEVTGLTGTGLVLQDNGGDDLAVTGNGPVAFPTVLTNGSAYSVSVLTQPSAPAQTCSITNASGNAGIGTLPIVSVSCQ